MNVPRSESRLRKLIPMSSRCRVYSLGARLTWILLAAIAALGGVAAAALHPVHGRGTAIVIRFSNGYGLRAGSDMRYRGVVVGRVTDVSLWPDLTGVEVRARLAPSAEGLAKEGSRFWIVRASASLAAGLNGLDTLVGDNYVTVRPAYDGKRAVSFEGDDDTPFPAPISGSFPLILKASRQSFALRPGAPVNCSGVPIGMVQSVDLVEDGKGIRAVLVIEPSHASKVRSHSHFYETAIFRGEGSLAKMSFKFLVDPQAIGGGIELEIPAKSDPPATPGQEFELTDRPTTT